MKPVEQMTCEEGEAELEECLAKAPATCNAYIRRLNVFTELKSRRLAQGAG